MTDLRKAAEMALTSLENIGMPNQDARESMEALRQALTRGEERMKDKIVPAVGLILGAAIWFFIGVQHGSNIKAMDMVEIYDAGKKDALKVSPRPSLELELTCANVWAGKVAPPEVFK